MKRLIKQGTHRLPWSYGREPEISRQIFFCTEKQIKKKKFRKSYRNKNSSAPVKESSNCVNSIYGGGDVVFTWLLDDNVISTCESVYIRIPLRSKTRKSSTIAADSIKSATPHYKLGSLSLQIRAALFYDKLGQDVITDWGDLVMTN